MMDVPHKSHDLHIFLIVIIGLIIIVAWIAGLSREKGRAHSIGERIQREAPYMQDKQLIFNRFAQLYQQIETLEHRVKALEDTKLSRTIHQE